MDLFKLKENNTTIRTEIIAGVTSFMTMAYIIAVNPGILSTIQGPDGLNYAGLVFSTIIISSIMSIVMGLISNNPYAVAPGMGLNAYIAFEVHAGGLNGLVWSEVMGAIIIAGTLLTIMSFTPVSSGLLKAIPKSLRLALAAGIGLFLVIIGFAGPNPGMGIIIPPYYNPLGWYEGTLLSMADANLNFAFFMFGLIFTAILMVKKVKGSFLIGIVATAILGGIFSINGWGSTIDPTFIPISMPTGSIFSVPDTRYFMKFDILGALKPTLIIPIFTLAFTDLFDSISTFIGVSEVGGLVDEDGNPKNFKRTLIADSLTTLMSGFAGTSDATTYIESAAGVEQGGRTGLTAIVTGLCFIPFMFMAPLLAAIPWYATSPILVLLGVLMFKPLATLDWSNFEESIPAFVAMIMIPLTYSITYGIVFGIIIYVLLKVIVGKIKEINVWLWITFAFAVFSFVADQFIL